MENEFLKLSASPLMNLDHTKRYSGTKLVEEETLSQHILDTIMMGLKIIDEVNYLAGEQIIDTKEYLMKAVYHDLEEAITGDIPRPLKYYNDDTLKSMRYVADQVAHRFFTTQFRSLEPHYTYWDTAKQGSEGIILKIVDTLVVAHKVVKEVTLLNNNYMLRVAHEVLTYLVELYDTVNISDKFLSYTQVKSYLLDVIDGAIRVMEKIVSDHYECMLELNVAGQSMI